MSYVSIWKPVNDRIVRASQGTRNEIIGLLLGRLQDNAIVIEDSITGEYSAEPHKATLPSDALAKIADGLVTGRIKGNIVGWYHSHTEGGLFFSETDIMTQRNLQQFSSLITGMVVDASNREVGFYRLDPQTGMAIRIPPEKITIYSERSEAVPAEAKVRPRIATPIVEVRRQERSPRQPGTRLAISIVLIALVVSVTIFGVLLYTGLRSPALAITHTPISTVTVGTPIEVKANVTGAVKNVTLNYAPTGGAFTQVPMNSTAGNSYRYLIPGDQVTSNMVYYITAFDKAGNKVVTGTYTIVAADFNILPQTSALSVYRNSTKSFSLALTLIQINNFTEPLSLTQGGAPQGVSITFTPNPAPPGTKTASILISAGPSAQLGTTPVTIQASYTPTGSAPVLKQFTLTITVSDFNLQVTPASATVSAGSVASLNASLAFTNGFVDQVNITVAGLPSGAKYQGNGTVIPLGGGAGTRTLNLRITVPISTKRGTYVITISASGGGVSHSQTVQLIVR